MTYRAVVIDLVPNVDDATRADVCTSEAVADTIDEAERDALSKSAVNCNRRVYVQQNEPPFQIVKGPYVLRRDETLPILHELADRYGMETPFDYVHDRWGSEPGQMTPLDAIDLHRRLNWTDDDYRVMRMAHKPGQPALVDENGNAILVVPEAHK